MDDLPETILTPWERVELATGQVVTVTPRRRLKGLYIRVDVSIIDQAAIDNNEAGCVLGYSSMGFDATECSRMTVVEANAQHQLSSALETAVANARADWDGE